MPKLRFVQTYVVKDELGTIYEKGKVYEFSEDSAQHWLSRNKAEIVDDKMKAATPKTKPLAEEEVRPADEIKPVDFQSSETSKAFITGR